MITRRDAVKVAAIAPWTLPALANAESKPAGYIDAHVHVWTPDLKAYPLSKDYSQKDMVPASFTPEELFAHAKPCGVSRIVLIQMSFYGYDNKYMLDCMQKHPGTFGGVAIVDDSKSDVAKTMKELAKSGVRGFRLYASKKNAEGWSSSAGIQAMWKCGADEGLNMCLLADPDALPLIQKKCEKYPKTPVVIDHFARLGMKGAVDPQDLDALCKLSKFEKVTVKTSAFYALGKKKSPYTDLGDMVKSLRDAYGAERLMWATDCPYQVQEGHTYADSIDLIKDRLSFLSASDKDWILRKTAERVFFS